MDLESVPAELYTLRAANGDPLLLYGEDAAGNAFLWPTPHIEQHRIAFARWTYRNVRRWRGKRLILQHPMCERTRRWAEWLGVHLEQGVAVIQ